LRRRHLFAAHFYPGIAVIGFGNFVRDHLDVFLDDIVFELTANQAFYGIQGIVGIGDRLALGRLAHQNFTVFGIGNNRRSGAIAFRVLNNLGLAPFHNRYAGIGGTQVDADNFAHIFLSGNAC
jgi:hypothetical protein